MSLGRRPIVVESLAKLFEHTNLIRQMAGKVETDIARFIVGVNSLDFNRNSHQNRIKGLKIPQKSPIISRVCFLPLSPEHGQYGGLSDITPGCFASKKRMQGCSKQKISVELPLRIREAGANGARFASNCNAGFSVNFLFYCVFGSRFL
jgi:hypothetical protein